MSIADCDFCDAGPGDCWCGDEDNRVMVHELAKWLLVRGYAEERSGYGHVSADALAFALTRKYNITFKGEQ